MEAARTQLKMTFDSMVVPPQKPSLMLMPALGPL